MARFAKGRWDLVLIRTGRRRLIRMVLSDGNAARLVDTLACLRHFLCAAWAVRRSNRYQCWITGAGSARSWIVGQGATRSWQRRRQAECRDQRGQVWSSRCLSDDGAAIAYVGNAVVIRRWQFAAACLLARSGSAQRETASSTDDVWLEFGPTIISTAPGSTDFFI